VKEKSDSWLPAYIALGVVWGCSFIFIKQGLEFLTPVGVTFGRTSLGAIALVLISRKRGVALPKEKKVWAHLWVVAMLLNVIPGFLFAYAEVRLTSVLAGIINAVTPLMTLLVMMTIFRSERVKRFQVLGLIVGFTGVLIVLGVWKGLGVHSSTAVLALLVAVTCYGFSFPYSRKYVIPRKLAPEALATTQVSLAALTLLPFYLHHGIARDSFRLGPILAMFALGVFGTGYAYIWNFRIMAAAGSAIASSVTYVTPVVAVIVGVLFLGESVTWNQPVGGAVVLLGAAVSQGRLSLNRK
jgi:drug/metabolite transporter (DMT)-like permease